MEDVVLDTVVVAVEVAVVDATSAASTARYVSITSGRRSANGVTGYTSGIGTSVSMKRSDSGNSMRPDRHAKKPAPMMTTMLRSIHATGLVRAME